VRRSLIQVVLPLLFCTLPLLAGVLIADDTTIYDPLRSTAVQ